MNTPRNDIDDAECEVEDFDDDMFAMDVENVPETKEVPVLRKSFWLTENSIK